MVIVDGRSSSVRSVIQASASQYAASHLEWISRDTPFCTLICAAEVFGFFLAAASSFFFIDQIW